MIFFRLFLQQRLYHIDLLTGNPQISNEETPLHPQLIQLKIKFTLLDRVQPYQLNDRTSSLLIEYQNFLQSLFQFALSEPYYLIINKRSMIHLEFLLSPQQHPLRYFHTVPSSKVIQTKYPPSLNIPNSIYHISLSMNLRILRYKEISIVFYD